MLPVGLVAQGRGGHVFAVDLGLVVAQGLQGGKAGGVFLVGEELGFRQQRVFLAQGAVTGHVGSVLVVAKGRELLRSGGIIAFLIGLMGQLVLHKGQPVLISGKGQPGDDHQRGDELPHPGKLALAADEILLVGEFTAGLLQCLAAMLGEGSLPLGDDGVHRLAAEAGEDLRLFPVAASAKGRVIQVGTAANTHPQSLLLLRVAAGHLARDGAQRGQLGGAVQIVGRVGDGVLLFAAPDAGIVEPDLLHRDLILFGGDMALHGHGHQKGLARRAVHAAAAVDDLGRLLAVGGGQEQRDLHAHHLQGGQVEQRHLAGRVFLRGQRGFPRLHRAGQVNTHRGHHMHVLS